MLQVEQNMTYYVYPSWANLTCPWGSLREHLSDPLQSPFIKSKPDLRRYNWKDLGYPDTIAKFELFDGPVGGGVVRAHVAPYAKWLPIVILGSGAMIRASDGMTPIADSFETGVFYLEPMNEPGWELGLGKKAKVYLCDATVEHAESADGEVYWIVPFKRRKKDPGHVNEVPRIARAFGLDVFRIGAIPEVLANETAPWFVDSSIATAWFNVRGDGTALGFHFAVMFYVGLRLSELSNQRGQIHLVARIQGKPNARIHWSRK